MTSYAQNTEDVLLQRVLADVTTGCYVDVGAGHPQYHSVTKHFYDSGWSGLNVEPIPVLAAALESQRPRDTTVQAAITTADVATVELSVADTWDELSTISPARAEQLRCEGRDLTAVEVPAARLGDLLDAHGPQETHFLKIDVEGAELQVLDTVDLRRWRPWVVLVEVLAAGSHSESRDAIRARMEGDDYSHAYFDGLNDFYVAAEHAEQLLPRFATPVNVTDDYLVHGSPADHGVLDLVAERVGLPLPAQPSEVLERVGALVRDRIAFEQRVDESQELLGTRAVQVAEAEHRAAELAQELTSWRLRVDALEQSAFERERMIAWYAAELAQTRTGNALHENHLRVTHAAEVAEHEARRQELQAERDSLAQSSAHAGAAVVELEARLRDVLASTSWRATLPLRVARRPRAYVRKARG